MSPTGVAVVSGASRSLGASIAHRLAADGWPVAVNYRRGRLEAEAVVSKIREAGGVAVVAHPYWDVKDPAQVEDLVRSLKPDGIEAYYPSHTKEQTEHLLRLCDELGLVPTASSDYHGPTHKTFAEFAAYDTFGLGEPQVPARP